MGKRAASALLGGLAILLAGLPDAGVAGFMPGTPWKRAEVFATCSGRLAALAARQQAERDPASTDTMRQREMFELMLEATLPEAVTYGVPQDEPLRWRSAGWVETAGLLADITYAGDEIRTSRAAAALDARISDCTGLLLGG